MTIKKNFQIFNSCVVLGRIGTRVYQRVRPGLGNVPSDPSLTLQDRAYVVHKPPGTPAQTLRRQRFANAVAAWHALTAEQQHDYNNHATSRNITGYNLYISERMRLG